jgi:hypothetical protein
MNEVTLSNVQPVPYISLFGWKKWHEPKKKAYLAAAQARLAALAGFALIQFL